MEICLFLPKWARQGLKTKWTILRNDVVLVFLTSCNLKSRGWLRTQSFSRRFVESSVMERTIQLCSQCAPNYLNEPPVPPRLLCFYGHFNSLGYCPSRLIYHKELCVCPCSCVVHSNVVVSAVVRHTTHKKCTYSYCSNNDSNRIISLLPNMFLFT